MQATTGHPPKPQSVVIQARAAGADQQLTGSCRSGLDQRDTEGINHSVQTEKPLQGWSGFKSRSNPHHPAICTNF